MSENGRSRRKGGFDEDSAQIHEHQKRKQDEEAQLEKIWKELENSDEGIEIDPDKFLRDMEILDELVPMPDFDLSASWQEFKEKHHDLLENLKSADQQSSAFASEEKSKRRRSMKPVRVTLVVVMILAMLLMASCGIIEYIIKAIGDWSEDTFGFRVLQELRVDNPKPELPETKDYESLEEALEDYGVTTAYTDDFIPERFSFQEVRVVEYANSVKFIAAYGDGEEELKFTIWHYKDSTSLELNAAEKMPLDAEIYMYEGTTFYLIENTENTTISWVEGVEKYSLWGSTSKAQAMQMINSINKGLS